MTTTEALTTQHEDFEGLDEREAAVITEAKFFEPYKADLEELFQALGREGEWSDDPRDMLSYMRRGWIGQEHGNSTEKDQFTDEQITAAMPILERMGFTTELLPQSGEHFDQAIVVEGTMVANYRRTELIQKAIENGVEMDEVVLWAGQRPREARDGKNEELLSTEGRFAGHDVADNSWVKKQVELGNFEEDKQWGLTETAFGRLAVNKVFDGELMPHRIDLKLTDVTGLSEEEKDAVLPKKLDGVPARDITDYRFKTPEGQEVILMNAAAVERGDAPARHTTRSCTEEWLERHAPAEGARVLYVTGNPHSLRTAQDTYKVLQELGRGDIELVVAGTSPAKTTTVQAYLGEVARLIDNDVKRNYDTSE